MYEKNGNVTAGGERGRIVNKKSGKRKGESERGAESNDRECEAEK